ncbi:MAG: bifunctional diaminohydroxyphosphoribosylaminopyrimidine deaminase/5-amino-6-(5-phosphoribosylamino)uracil reductase RibD [Gammaproteobacteria bacterium]|nr:bifunctional diaminohydroxyphosphoribosylaminopyrimidine deaminase/5-amino-6-(5-phosphoribosylamino)uracil reductase RibD [Gammaproteobacteria bacterium]
MARALELAARGRYSARPNPVVGCVIVKDDAVIGEGWHQRAGDDHAEINALRACGDQADGATAYVTLEPCAHHGKTPPCADALIASKVRRVVAAMKDPFDAVAGRGLEKLAAAGVATEVGLMEAAARALNEGFISRVTRGRPFVRAKVAASIDGATAMDSGESQWITGAAARDDVQRLRAESGAIMTGIGTVLADDPCLNLRSERFVDVAEQPLRVILDSALQTPPSAAMLRLPGATLICCCGGDDSALVGAGAEVRTFAEKDGKVDVAAVLQHLAERQVNDVLVEAGPILTGYMLQESLLDELVIYQSPHIMGGSTRRMFDTPSWTTLADRRSLEITDVRQVGADTRITARVKS